VQLLPQRPRQLITCGQALLRIHPLSTPDYFPPIPPE
jgi:hypothetical protein